MIRGLNPTRIELKKVDLEEFEQKVRDNPTNENRKSSADTSREPLPTDATQKQAAINKRIGYQPQSVPSDGATNIHF